MKEEIKNEILASIRRNIEYDSRGCDLDELVSDELYDKYNFKEVYSDIVDKRRWVDAMFTVTKVTNKENETETFYIGASWDCPATENQEGIDTYLKIYEVEPKEVITISYVPKT